MIATIVIGGCVDRALQLEGNVVDGAPRDLAVRDASIDHGARDLSVQIDSSIVQDAALPADLSATLDLSVADVGTPQDLGKTPEGILAGDFNEDGVPDVVTVNWGVNYTGDVAVLLGNGDGTFQPQQHIYAGPGPFSAVATDLDGDGHLDLVASGRALWTLTGDGAGNFTSRFYDGEIETASAVFDADGDGLLDAWTSEANQQLFRFWQGHGAFGLTSSSSVVSVPQTLDDLLHGQFGTGGVGGLASYGYLPNGTLSTPRLTIFLLDAANHATGLHTYDLGGHPSDAAAGDLDGDGIDDIVVALQSGGFAFYHSVGDGTLSPPASIDGGQPGGICIGDLNTDGIADVVLGSTGVQVYFGLGGGTFAAPIAVDTGGSPVRLTTVDLDGDGLPDIAAQNKDTSVSVVMNYSIP